MWLAANILGLLALTVLGLADAIHIMGILDPNVTLLATDEATGEELAKLGALLLVGVTGLAFAAIMVGSETARMKLALAAAVGCVAIILFPLNPLWFLLAPAAVLAGSSALLRALG